jgi:DNA repair protein RecO (recombination protein O)
MFRHSVTQAIVLHTHRFGEIHKGVTLLTRDMGIITAVAHGALKTKSRLRSLTDSFCCSRTYLYFEPVRGTYKITDMVPISYFEGLRDSLDRYYAASLWTEVVIKSFAGGEIDSRVYDLLKSCLTFLEKIEEDSIDTLSFQFLWRYLKIIGFSTDPNSCSQCGRSLEQEENSYLCGSPPSFSCRHCQRNERLILTPGARRFLSFTTGKPLKKVLMFSLDRDSRVKLKGLLYELLQQVLETSLNSIECIKGMI